MLKPTSLVHVRINEFAAQKREYASNAEDALITMMNVVASLSKEEVTPSTVETASQSMKDTYYNKFKKDDMIYDKSIAPEGHPEDKILKDEAFYISVAKGIPADLSYVSIGGVRRKADETVKLSIGMSAFIKAPLWKVDETGVLKVAIPYLCAAADVETGMSTVVAGGIVYNVPAFTPVEGAKPMVISKAVIENKEGCAGAVTVDGNKVDAAIGHCGQMAGLVLSSNGKAITDTALLVYVLKNDGTASITTPEMCNGENVTYAWYSFPYSNRPVSEEEDGIVSNTVKRLVVPGYGSLEVSIHAEKVYTAPTV